MLAGRYRSARGRNRGTAQRKQGRRRDQCLRCRSSRVATIVVSCDRETTPVPAPRSQPSAVVRVAFYNIRSGQAVRPLPDRPAPFAAGSNCTDHRSQRMPGPRSGAERRHSDDKLRAPQDGSSGSRGLLFSGSLVSGFKVLGFSASGGLVVVSCCPCDVCGYRYRVPIRRFCGADGTAGIGGVAVPSSAITVPISAPRSRPSVPARRNGLPERRR